MPVHLRRELIDHGVVGAYHCYSRCVRRAFLCGEDGEVERDYRYRLDWVRNRLEALAQVFAIDVLDYAVMENHLHTILRNRPEVARGWSKAEVVRRWSRLSRRQLELLDAASDAEVAEELEDDERVEKLRERLSNVSWFMIMLKEPLSRKANREDKVSGHFWAERFGSVQLLDEESLLVCSLYVDLKAIRAGRAGTPEDSTYTGACDRLRDWQVEAVVGGELQASALRRWFGTEVERAEFDWGPLLGRRRSGWLSPVRVEGDGYDGVTAKRRASDKGYLPMTLVKYLELLDECGRREVEGKRGVIPAHLPPILDRLGLDSGRWSDACVKEGKRFRWIAEQCAEQERERQQRQAKFSKK